MTRGAGWTKRTPGERIAQADSALRGCNRPPRYGLGGDLLTWCLALEVSIKTGTVARLSLIRRSIFSPTFQPTGQSVTTTQNRRSSLKADHLLSASEC